MESGMGTGNGESMGWLLEGAREVVVGWRNAAERVGGDGGGEREGADPSVPGLRLALLLLRLLLFLLEYRVAWTVARAGGVRGVELCEGENPRLSLTPPPPRPPQQPHRQSDILPLPQPTDHARFLCPTTCWTLHAAQVPQPSEFRRCATRGGGARLSSPAPPRSFSGEERERGLRWP
ncbi:unnamed protein product [Lampetra fluviatilis]